MNKQLSLKVVTFALLSIFILSLGAGSFAKMKEPDSINWTYINVCSYGFEHSDISSTALYCSGTTTTCSQKNAYVKVVLQQYKNGSWKTYATLTDEGYMGAAIDDDIEVATGYTYRLKITHEARTTSGTTVETYTQYSGTLAVI